MAACDRCYFCSFCPQVGDDLQVVVVDSVQEALDACSLVLECKGVAYEGRNVNGTINKTTHAFLRGSPTYRMRSGTTLSSWVKSAPAVSQPAAMFNADDVAFSLREGSFSVQWLNATRSGVSNFSFVPSLNSGSALPFVQHLGDMTMRIRSHEDEDWVYYSSAGGALTATATPALPLRKGEFSAHDITPLLDASAKNSHSKINTNTQLSPLTVRRSYQKPPDGGPGVSIVFELTNTANKTVTLGAFGMAVPAAVAQDVHVGGQHGWVEWHRVHVNSQLHLDKQCLIATPHNHLSNLEAYRPIFEYWSGGFEWTVHTQAWAEEWEKNLQWPYFYMAQQLNNTGIFPHPRTPWPSWGDGGHTVSTPLTSDTHWNNPTGGVLAPGE